MRSRRTKIAVVASHPIQYWAPVYRQLAQHSDVDLSVFYVAENGAEEYFDREFDRVVKWDCPLTDGYEFEFLRPGFKLSDFGFLSVDANNIKQKLAKFSPDFVLINGYGYVVNWRTAFAITDREKVIYISDSNPVDTRSFWRKILKKILLGFFFRRVGYFLTTSPRNTQYLLEHNVDKSQFFDAPLPTDIAWLDRQRRQVTDEQLERIRYNLNLNPGHTVILFVGKLLPHKRPEDVVRLIHGLREKKVSAVIVGSGESLNGLKKLSNDLGVSSRVHFIGFVNQSGLAKYFKLSDIVVFPSSREPYGLIASEVLPFGLPIIAADNIGAVGASIREGLNALLYPCGDIRELTKQVQRLLADEVLRKNMSDESSKLAKQFDSSVLVDRILGICKGKNLSN